MQSGQVTIPVDKLTQAYIRPTSSALCAVPQLKAHQRQRDGWRKRVSLVFVTAEMKYATFSINMCYRFVIMYVLIASDMHRPRLILIWTFGVIFMAALCNRAGHCPM